MNLGAILFAALLSRPVTITADHLDVLDKEHKAVYRGHAHAIRDTTVLDCDTLTVFYSDKREVQHIEAEGNVEAVDGDRHAWGDTANYENATGILTVHGNPRVQQGNRHVVGDEILFTTGVDRVEITTPQTTADATAIAADRLVLEGDRHVAKWEGHVKAK